MSLSDTRATEAQILARRESYWHAWRQFLAEQRAQLEHGGRPDDDLTVALDASGGTALPAALEAELSDLFEALRQDELLAHPGADPDELLRTLLDRLDNELHGRAHPDGLALVRLPDAGQPVTFDHRAIIDQLTPDDLAALVGTTRQKRRWHQHWAVRLALVAGLSVVITGVGLLSSPQSTGTPSPPAQVRLGTTQTGVWDVQALVVAGVTAPRPRVALGGAGLAACATEAQRAAVQPGATVVLSSTAAVRTYQIVTLQPDPAIADLILSDCSVRPTRRFAGAALQVVRTAAPLDPQLVKGVEAWASDVRPAEIPAGQMEVVLVLTPGASADGVLVLPDGSTRAPAAAPETTPDGTRVRFLLPASSTVQRMALQLAHGTGLPKRLPLDVPAPVGRAALLGQALRVTSAEASQIGVTLALTLTLQRAGVPLGLFSTDLSVTDAQGRMLPTTWTPPADLATGTATPVAVSLTLPPEASGPLQVALGAWRMRVNLESPAQP